MTFQILHFGNPSTCNYDSAVTTNDGSCTYPQDSCYNCNNILDADGDGVCDADGFMVV